jgi:hypothetical protein
MRPRDPAGLFVPERSSIASRTRLRRTPDSRRKTRFQRGPPTDPDHQRIREYFAANSVPVLTTDDCIDETLTLLPVRGETSRAMEAGREFFERGFARVHFVSPEQIHRAWCSFNSMRPPVGDLRTVPASTKKVPDTVPDTFIPPGGPGQAAWTKAGYRLLTRLPGYDYESTSCSSCSLSYKGALSGSIGQRPNWIEADSL